MWNDIRESSLYLNNSIEAVNPVFYDDNLTYSSLVVRKSSGNKTLDISVICYNNTQETVALKAKISTYSRHDSKEYSVPEDLTYLSHNKAKSVLIIGASSLIANSFCLEIAKSG